MFTQEDLLEIIHILIINENFMKKLLLIISILFITQIERVQLNMNEFVEVEQRPQYIGNFGQINNILFHSDYIYIETNNAFVIYSLTELVAEKIINLSNFIIGIDEEIIICTWENFVINKPDEIATKVKVINENQKILSELHFTQTVAPIICKKDLKYFRDNYPGNPERIYLKDNYDKLHVTEDVPQIETFISDDYSNNEYMIKIGENNDIWLSIKDQ